MVSESYRKKTVGWIAGVGVAVALTGVTGCSDDSDDTDSGAEKKPTKSSSATADSEKGKDEDGSATSPPSAGGQSTAEEVVATWVTAILTDKPKQACLVMGEPATDSSPAQVGTEKRCDSKKVQDGVGNFKEAFTPKPPSDDPKVEVAKSSVTDGKAVFPAEKITVDGKTLDKIILSNSTGLKPGQVDVKMESSKIKDAWYVTNMDFNIG